MAGNGGEKFTYEYYKDFVCRLREAYRLTTLREGKSQSQMHGRPQNEK